MNITDTPTAQHAMKQEGKTTAKIEAQTSKVPSGTFLALAFGSIAASGALMAARHRHLANFVGQWAPTILAIGLYNKLVKVENELLALHPGGQAGTAH